jgi:hypothetical protein
VSDFSEIRPSLTTSKEGLKTINIYRKHKDLTLDWGCQIGMFKVGAN